MELVLYATLVVAAATVVIGLLILQKANQPHPLLEGLPVRLVALEQVVRDLPDKLRDESRVGREEIRGIFTLQTTNLESRFAALEGRFNDFSKAQVDQFIAMRSETSDGRSKLEEVVRLNAEGFAASQSERLKQTSDAVDSLANRLLVGQRDARDEQKTALEVVTTNIVQLTQGNERRLDALRETLSGALEALRVDNAEKLEKMRATVDEKLQGTLEKRLGESFQIVSERLEQVHKGLGEMQSLATGVGYLKRVLSNVKSRGGWGEVQLGMLLEDILTQDQFAANVQIRPDSGEIVEFAVRLPGRGSDDTPLWLPVDAKFPQEDYDRLLQAQESGVAEEVEKAAAALERALRLQAKAISEKYVHPPHSTDFAVMYLPTEGLFAEAIRRPGLASDLQNKYRVMIQGPTTLSAMLSSLQMGFRTLAIEKRSSEVWHVLSAAKEEFIKYGHVWERLGKQLDTARRTVEDAGRRTRAVTRKLRDVETLNIAAGTEITDIVSIEMEDDLDVREDLERSD